MFNLFFSSEISELDLLDECLFSQMDYEIFKLYEVIVDGLVMFIGSYCEIVLYLLEDLKSFVVRIVNGEYIGWQIGFFIIDFVLWMLYDMVGVDSSVLRVYFMCVKSGVLMKFVIIVI